MFREIHWSCLHTLQVTDFGTDQNPHLLHRVLLAIPFPALTTLKVTYSSQLSWAQSRSAPPSASAHQRSITSYRGPASLLPLMSNLIVSNALVSLWSYPDICNFSRPLRLRFMIFMTVKLWSICHLHSSIFNSTFITTLTPLRYVFSSVYANSGDVSLDCPPFMRKITDCVH